MPPPLLSPLSRATTSSRWTCHACRARTLPPRLLLRSRPPYPAHTSSFHTTGPLHTTHYETLHLPPTATPADIKRQFYTLSKQHHPDRNPHDPSASTRFVAISEAYHVLSVPEKRAQYDLHLSETTKSRGWGGGSRHHHHHPTGSFSSASFAGSRPASGLNKKRSTFRGPPPSFYKSGGYGRHGAKRAEHAHSHQQHQQQAHSAAEGQEAGPGSYGGFDGFGPGQTSHGNEVPHFNDRRHKETHDHVNEHIQGRRRRARASEIPVEIDRGGMLVNFMLVASAVGFIGMTAKIFSDKSDEKQRRRDTS